MVLFLLRHSTSRMPLARPLVHHSAKHGSRISTRTNIISAIRTIAHTPSVDSGSAEAEPEPYWTHLRPWKDVKAHQFLVYSWQVRHPRRTTTFRRLTRGVMTASQHDRTPREASRILGTNRTTGYPRRTSKRTQPTHYSRGIPFRRRRRHESGSHVCQAFASYHERRKLGLAF